MTGEKRIPLIIGKSKKPRCFNRINPETLPVTYRNNKRAWMTSVLMIEWLKSVDRKMKKQRRNILLFLDNAPSHPHVTLSNIKLVFLPPNTTCLTQPMDQGIIQTMKLKYRRRQLGHVLSQMDTCDKSGPSILREISILNAIYWVNGAWRDTEPLTIQKCFAKAGFTKDAPTPDPTPNPTPDDDNDVEDEVPLAVLKMARDLFGVGYGELASLDCNVHTCDTNVTDWSLDANDILGNLNTNQDDDDDEDDDDDSVEQVVEDSCSIQEAHIHIDKLKGFALHKGSSDLLDYIMNYEERLISESANMYGKQKKISDFFTPTTPTTNSE